MTPQSSATATAFRAATIMLGREATDADAADLGFDIAALIKRALKRPDLVNLALRDQVTRAYNAAFGRYDTGAPSGIDHFMRLLALGDFAVGDALSNQSSLADFFCLMQRSGYRDDPCAAPATMDAPMAVARDGNGNPLLFAVGANRQLTLFRLRDGAWGQLNLSEALPSPRHCHMQALDVQQNIAGKLTIAISVCARRGDADSTLYLGTEVSNALDDAGWLAALGTMKARPGGPVGANIDKVTIAAVDSANPMVMVGAAIKGIMNSYYFETGGPPAPWTMLPIPEDADTVIAYAVGQYRYPGVWTLYRVGAGISLIFSSFPDSFGKTINLDYTGLPANCTSFRLGVGPDIPDVYVAGDGVAVYRASHANPEPIIAAGAVPGATLVWTSSGAGGEHVALLSADQRLIAVSKGPSGWSAPSAIADGFDAAVLLSPADTGALSVIGLTPGGALEWRHTVEGGGIKTDEITQHAVWEETPLTLDELTTAIAAASPVVYLATDEQNFPSTVQFYLAKVGLWNQIQQKWELDPGTLLDHGTNDLIAAAIEARPRSPLNDPTHDSDYVLKIQDADYPSLLPGNPQDAPFYIHAKFNPAENATDLIFWAFYPYNGAGLLKLDTAGLNRRVDLQPLGVHEGDWEHFLLRVDNESGQAVQTYLSEHDSGDWKDISVMERDKPTGRLVFYISRHGHACYTQQGDNLLKEQKAGLYDIGLINHCDQGKRINAWEDGRTSLISAPWLAAAAPTEPMWLQMPWRWGRYFDFSTAQVQQTLNSILADVVPAPITDLVASMLIDSGKLGDEGNSAGPQAIKLKNNWYCGEND